jgi:hypothetical protein
MRFIAAINTRIYGRSYAQGAEIDITGWTRKQMLQFLNLGLMQASQITAGMITDAIVFTGAGVTTTVDDQGRLVVEITEVWPYPRPPAPWQAWRMWTSPASWTARR